MPAKVWNLIAPPTFVRVVLIALLAMIVSCRDAPNPRETDRRAPAQSDASVSPRVSDDGPRSLRVGGIPPNPAVTTLNGARLNDLYPDGSVVLLDFWATWCAPCIQELPYLMALHERFAQRADFRMMGVSLDGDEKSLKDFLRRRGITWPQVFGDDALKIADGFGVSAIPAGFIIGRDGAVVAIHPPANRLEQIIGELLDSK